MDSQTPATQAGANTAQAMFLGITRAYWRLLIRGAVLLVATLGLYRFWLATDIRRFLWSNTEIAGERFEYAGTALELLAGFLVAVVMLVPLYAGFFFIAVHFGILGALSTVIGFFLLAILGQYAAFRARRYRLTRTIYRGVRFHQSGSAWRYAMTALFWWALVALTLGLAYPWACARLERYKMRNTYFGDLAGDFESRGLSLFWRGLWMWLVIFLPFLAAVFAAIGSVDWTALSDRLENDSAGDVTGWIEGANPAFGFAIAYAIMAVSWVALSAALLYPAFQTITLRWWLNGLRCGAIRIESRLRGAQVYKAYFRFLIYCVLFALLVGTVSFAALALAGLAEDRLKTQSGEIVATLGLLVTYVVVALGYSTIYQATVRLALWRAAINSLALEGTDALTHVRATGHASSSLGEGLADALHVGGI